MTSIGATSIQVDGGSVLVRFVAPLEFGTTISPSARGHGRHASVPPEWTTDKKFTELLPIAPETITVPTRSDAGKSRSQRKLTPIAAVEPPSPVVELSNLTSVIKNTLPPWIFHHLRPVQQPSSSRHHHALSRNSRRISSTNLAIVRDSIARSHLLNICHLTSRAFYSTFPLSCKNCKKTARSGSRGDGGAFKKNGRGDGVHEIFY